MKPVLSGLIRTLIYITIFASLYLNANARDIPGPEVVRPNEANEWLAAQGADAKYMFAPDEDLTWWKNARFGVFTHWNAPSAVVGTEVSWGRRGPRPQQGKPQDAEWAIPMDIYDNAYTKFNPSGFDADAYVRMIKDAGARYFVFTAKHHDGFCMFDSAYTDYDIMNTPYGKDVCMELALAAQKHGIKLLWYYSQPDWTHPDYIAENMKAYNKYLFNQIDELLEYPGVAGIWFDDLAMHPDTFDAMKLIKSIRLKNPGMLINSRVANKRWRFGDWDTPEQHLGDFQIDRPWETCMTMGAGWSYNKRQTVHDLIPYEMCIRSLIFCSGGNGNLLLNVGPNALGKLMPEEVATFEAMGDWLSTYGESIYSTRGGPYTPGLWGTATRSTNAIYLHLLQLTTLNTFELPDPGMKVKGASLLTGGKVQFSQENGKIIISVEPDDYQDVSTIVKLDMDGDPWTLEKVVSEPESVSNAIIAGAGGATISASSEHKEYPVANIMSGSSEKRAGARHRKGWKYSKDDDDNPWLMYEFPRPTVFNAVFIEEKMAWTQMAKGFTLEYQDKNGDWHLINERDFLGHACLTFDRVKAKKLRLNIKRAPGGETEILAFKVFHTKNYYEKSPSSN